MLVFTRTLAGIALLLSITGVESRQPSVLNTIIKNTIVDSGKETFKAVAELVPVGKVGEFFASPWLSTFSSVASIASTGWLIYKDHERTQQWENERHDNKERFEEIHETFKVMSDALSQMSINERKYVDEKFDAVNERLQQLGEERKHRDNQFNELRSDIKDIKDQLRSDIKDIKDQLRSDIKDIKDQLLELLKDERVYVDKHIRAMQGDISSLLKRIENLEHHIFLHIQETNSALSIMWIVIVNLSIMWIVILILAVIILCPLLMKFSKIVYKVLRTAAAMLSYVGQDADHPVRVIYQPAPALNQQAVPNYEEGIQNQEANAISKIASADPAQNHLHEE